MEPFDRSDFRRPPLFTPGGGSGLEIALSVTGARKRTPRMYRVCDVLTQALVCSMVVFTPWAFGTTQSWSIWAMNVAAYALGGLLALKWLIRWRTGHRPSRWGDEFESDDQRPRTKVQGPETRGQMSEVGGQWSVVSGQKSIDEGSAKVRVLTICLAGLTVFVLAFCLISALNARATYVPSDRRFEYHDYLKWLPHSYDRASTWNIFWSYLGLACFFWALRDWLLGKTRHQRHDQQAESRSHRQHQGEDDPDVLAAGSAAHTRLSEPTRHGAFALPGRLRLLLWVLCVNGALVALEAILQRLSGTNKLLWLIVPRFDQDPLQQFGPFAYKSNAASFLNLIWPVCLGFWLLLRKATARKHRAGARVGGGSYVMLLPCAVVIAAAPIFSVSRGGAAVAILGIVIATLILFFASRREGAWTRAAMLSLFLFILGFSAYLGWKQLQERLENIFVDNMSDRPQIYTNSLPIARDFPVFGSGPGTFGTIYQLYKEPNQIWDAYVHDDFLETRITFGWVGFTAVLAMLGLVLLRWFFPPGIPAAWEFVSFTWLALGGCLFHAKFDYPFQIYSILFLFLLLCSVLFCLSRK